jgi:putative PIN family toxin of toxin-antitoxin system
MIGLVLDTNVVVSANLNSEGYEALVVSLALNRKVRLFVSRPILEEYERVLLYPRLKFDAREVCGFMAILRKIARVVTPARTITESVDDSDNRFLECAETAQADFLVTGNKRHFPKRWTETQVVNAREFVEAIGPSFLR